MTYKKVCIVGGGSAGWMTATTFAQLLDFENITLVESPNVPICGVGESTLQQINHWLNLIDINHRDFLKKTNGTLKHSIKFTNFLTKNSGSFHYPFGGHPPFNSEIWWTKNFMNEDSDQNEYAQKINYLALIAEKGKLDASSTYAFHFDAIKFGQYLKENYCQEVENIRANVIGWQKCEEGIEYLILDDGQKIYADLFVDCTGFKSQLLGEYLEEPFISYNHLIPNDSALSTHIEYTDKEKEMVAYTECTAINNGWVWNIPLWSRIGTGYVYSSKHINDEDAKKEFVEHLESKGFDTSKCQFKKISMRIGRHQKTFVKNVVAIGLSAGFIEPLESNGLFTVHENLIKLYKTLRRGKPSQFMKDLYNEATSIAFDEFADFVSIHYAFTQREDTQYWRDNFNKSYNLNEINSYKKYGISSFSNELYNISAYQYPDSGFHYIASGMNVCAYTIPNADTRLINEMKKVNEDWEKIADKLPTPYQFLKDNVHRDN